MAPKPFRYQQARPGLWSKCSASLSADRPLRPSAAPGRVPTPPAPCPQPWFLPSVGGHRETGFWAPKRTFPGAKERRARGARKVLGRLLHPGWANATGPASRLSRPTGRPIITLESPLKVPVLPGTRSRPGSRGPLSAAGAQPKAPSGVVAGGPALPLATRSQGLLRRCPPQREPSAPGSGEASVFPTPVARGAQEQPPDAPRRLEGEGLGLGLGE